MVRLNIDLARPRWAIAVWGLHEDTTPLAHSYEVYFTAESISRWDWGLDAEHG